jgi:Flp pilus assembly protein TadD
MQRLEPPDLHHARAVHGWLDLANPREAALELSQVSAPSRSHPEVLEAHWRLCAVERRWEDALRVAGELVAAAPDALVGYVDRAYALHELRRTAEARALLLPLARRFPQASVVPYNLACYTCQLGDLAEARRWLRRALKSPDREELRRRALEDADLQPLWPEIGNW